MNISSKEQHLLETEILCNILNVFIVTFDQFNASLRIINKFIIGIFYYLKNHTNHKHLNGSVQICVSVTVQYCPIHNIL